MPEHLTPTRSGAGPEAVETRAEHASRELPAPAALASRIGNRAFGGLLQRQVRPDVIDDPDLLRRLDLRRLVEAATSDEDYWVGNAILTREWIGGHRELVEEQLVAKLREVVRFDFKDTLDREDALTVWGELIRLRPRLLQTIARHMLRKPEQWRAAFASMNLWYPRLYVELTVQIEKLVGKDIPVGPGSTPNTTYPVCTLHFGGLPEVAGVDVKPHARHAEMLDYDPGLFTSETIERFTFPVEVPLRRVPKPTPPPVPIPAPMPIRVPAEVLFEFDKAEIRPEAARTLLALLGDRPAHADPDRPVDVTGHTDAIGDPDYNKRLSERRANAVKALLERQFPGLRVNATGLGETQPIAPNWVGGRDNPAGRAKNRRVEIVLHALQPQ